LLRFVVAVAVVAALPWIELRPIQDRTGQIRIGQNRLSSLLKEFKPSMVSGANKRSVSSLAWPGCNLTQPRYLVILTLQLELSVSFKSRHNNVIVGKGWILTCCLSSLSLGCSVLWGSSHTRSHSQPLSFRCNSTAVAETSSSASTQQTERLDKSDQDRKGNRGQPGK
jgi:hypothetical protein